MSGYRDSMPMPAPGQYEEHSAVRYKSGDCRCRRCTDEWNALMAGYRRRRGQKPRPEGWGDLSKNHGTRSRYNSGCRCEPCRQANRDYARRRYADKS